jgi:hypothetical protein
MEILIKAFPPKKVGGLSASIFLIKKSVRISAAIPNAFITIKH